MSQYALLRFFIVDSHLESLRNLVEQVFCGDCDSYHVGTERIHLKYFRLNPFDSTRMIARFQVLFLNLAEDTLDPCILLNLDLF